VRRRFKMKSTDAAGRKQSRSGGVQATHATQTKQARTEKCKSQGRTRKHKQIVTAAVPAPTRTHCASRDELRCSVDSPLLSLMFIDATSIGLRAAPWAAVDCDDDDGAVPLAITGDRHHDIEASSMSSVFISIGACRRRRRRCQHEQRPCPLPTTVTPRARRVWRRRPWLTIVDYPHCTGAHLTRRRPCCNGFISHSVCTSSLCFLACP
jgi:hypothetical protein